MSTDSSARYVLLNRLADEIAERCRRGERPPVQEYLNKHPDLADDIPDLFAALVEIEQVKEGRRDVEAAAPTAAPAVRDRLGDYRIVGEIGRGGMGVVYEAEQVSLGRRVALKVLPQKLFAPEQKRRFEREARAAAKLHHTNIVPVFGVGEQDGVSFYIMQLIQGQGLDKVLDELRRMKDGKGIPAEEPPTVAHEADAARSLLTGVWKTPADNAPDAQREFDSPTPVGPCAGPGKQAPRTALAPAGARSDFSTPSPSSAVLPGQSGEQSGRRGRKHTYWLSVASIGVQVASALEHAHRLGVLHRDIKPSNLLLDAHGTVWVTDFGLAKAEDQENLTHTGDVFGTLRYMAPEAFEGKTDARSEVYALGLALYELLALRPAFDEVDRAKLMKQVTAAEPARLGRLNPQAPHDLETITHKAIERDPAHRYQTAAELADDLQRFLDDEPIKARRLSLVERLARWARRNKGIAAALSAVALLLVAIAAGALLAAAHFQRQEQEQRQLAGKSEKLAEEKGQLVDQEAQARTRAEEARNDAVAARQREAALRQQAEDQSEKLRWTLYCAEMNLGGQAVESPSGIGRVSELLAPWRRSKPDLRGWEWYYLQGLCHRDLLTLRGHSSGVHSVSWSPDGKRLASASGDRTVKVWDAASGRETLTLRGHNSRVQSVSWSPDGKRLASASGDRTVKVWDAASGKETLALRESRDRVWSVAWSPDGTRLASGGDRTILVYDATIGYTVECSPVLLPLLDRRLTADPKSAGDWRLRAEIHAVQGDWDRAAADAQHYLALRQDQTTR